MTVNTRAYKKYGTAKKAASGTPVLKVGNLYIVGVNKLTDIALIDPNGHYTGEVIAAHLDRLGNANWARPVQFGGANQRKRIWPDFGGAQEAAAPKVTINVESRQ